MRRHSLKIAGFNPEFERSILDCFEEQVTRHAQRLAVKAGDYELTYKLLDEVTNQIAQAILADFGPGEEPVAAFLESSTSLALALIGILKAGKVYVPIEPSHPKERLISILEDIDARLIVTDDLQLPQAQRLNARNAKIINLHGLYPGISNERPELKIPAEALACVLYTSGSTGEPKGVMHTHRNVLHATMRYARSLNLRSQDKIIRPSSFALAGGLRAMLGALLYGAACVATEREAFDQIKEMLVQEEATILHATPAVFRYFLGAVTRDETFPSLRLIYVAGDRLYKSDVEQYKQLFASDCELVHSLSLTEAGSIRHYFIDGPNQIIEDVVPVGYPVPDIEILILDEDGTPVEPGSVGEIAVRSSYLSPGYWRKPHLTKFFFVPDHKRMEKHIYLTGDLGRMLPDNCLLHFGRKDFQLKVRGYRINAEEVERALKDLPGIKETVVMVRTDRQNDERLVAYLVCQKAERPTITAARQHLSEKLPGYMIPSTFVFMDFFPLTANGKVDRSMLPKPGLSRPELDNRFVVPRTDTEDRLAQIWIDVLGIEPIGIYDDFFELGGHSLLAAQITSRLRQAIRVNLPLRWIFETPTVADLSLRIEAIGRDESDVLPLITRVQRSKTLPASFSQERLWFLDQFEPESCVYNLPYAARLKGSLNQRALKRALDTIVTRHEALRTTLVAKDGRPVQVINESHSLCLKVIDISDSLETEHEANAQALLEQHVRRPFDLSSDPMLRAVLIRLKADDHILLLVMHHVATDGWSMGVLSRELGSLYDSFAIGDNSPLSDLPIQYADFAHWQRQWFKGEALDRQVVYWKKQLGGDLPALDLPTDKSRPSAQTYQGARLPVAIDASLMESLKVLSRQEGVSLFMILLAAFQALLHRYTGKDDILIGSPIASRNQVEIEHLIGFFVNIIVLRTELAGDPTFQELLSRVRSVCLEAYAHQDLPFEKLVYELQPERDLSRSPLFQVMFILQNAPRPALELKGLTVDPLQVDRRTAQFDLTLSLTEGLNGLSGWMEYNTDLFETPTIMRMWGHFRVLLEEIVVDPNRPLSSLPLLTAAEHHQLIVKWNETQEDYSEYSCLHQLFEIQRDYTPEAVAAVFEQKHLNYRELNIRANKLAHYIKKRGVGPGVLVAICVDRSLEMLIGLLGILKAGGAYVPLDPDYPKERLSFVIEDTKAPILVTQRHLLEKLPDCNAERVLLDADWRTIFREKECNPTSDATADDLAYVIHTSGSTGNPKGIRIPHRAVVNFMQAMQRESWLSSRDKLLAVTTLSFDIAALELFLPLTVGACVVVAKKEVAADGERLSTQLSEHSITLMQATPATWQLLLTSGWISDRNLKILCGGEMLTRELSKRLQKTGRSLWNMYGPTETTIWSTIYPVNSDERSVSIGRPIANTQTYILDPNLKPVPIGVPGELYIGGVGLARGYLNRPELTDERFVPNHFSHEPTARLYRTGDMARYRSDGNIEFLGRIDHQVKIRGYRIELGEVEAVLAGHPGIREVVVVARADSRAEKRLVAYVVHEPKRARTTDNLRSFLKKKLPSYMIPSIFVSLNELPLTPNGKIDRQSLPAPYLVRGDLESNFVAPRTPMEKVLAEIWLNVLGAGRIGIHDDFFELGGHSLLAFQVIYQVRSTLQMDIPFRCLFDMPTVAQLTPEIVRRKAEQVDNERFIQLLTDL